MYEKDLEELIEKELSGDFKKFMIAVAQAARHEDDPVDHDKAKQDAQALHEAGKIVISYCTNIQTVILRLKSPHFHPTHLINDAHIFGHYLCKCLHYAPAVNQNLILVNFEI